MPSILSRLAPAGVKGSVMGAYSSSQFMGAFTGGLLGGAIASHYGPQMIFLAMAAFSLVWFGFAMSMQQLKKSKSYSLTTDITCEERADEVAEHLAAMPGVIEATLVHTEAVAYIKIDDKVADIQEIKLLLKS